MQYASGEAVVDRGRTTRVAVGRDRWELGIPLHRQETDNRALLVACISGKYCMDDVCSAYLQIHCLQLLRSSGITAAGRYACNENIIIKMHC